jgi:signal transduction histidine kinase
MARGSEQVDAAMAIVAAGIAHEVRNPLNAVQINLRILDEELRRLEQPERTSHAHEILGRIENEIRSLDSFVAEFLRFARPRKPQLEEIGLARLIADLAAFLAPECERRGVTLAVRADGGPRTASLDPLLIKHALLNLVLNAAQACDDGGSVTVSTAPAEGQRRVRITVRDDGPGIPADALPRVFDAFFTTREGGTGLGLPIARRIVEDHGGALWLECPPEGGTMAILELP